MMLCLAEVIRLFSHHVSILGKWFPHVTSGSVDVLLGHVHAFLIMQRNLLPAKWQLCNVAWNIYSSPLSN